MSPAIMLGGWQQNRGRRMPEGPMTGDEIRLEMRFYAVEILFANLFAISCLREAYPRRFIADVRQQLVEAVRTRGFPSLGPPTSELFLAELENAVSRLMEMVSEQLNVVLQAHFQQNSKTPSVAWWKW
jgi:hypothetical protein